MLLIGVALALPCAVAMWWLLGRALLRWAPIGPGGAEPELPVYGLELSPEPEHDEPPGRSRTARVRADGVLTIAVRPAQAVVGAVTAQAFLADGKILRPWAVRFERSEAGTFLLRARVEDLPGLEVGRHELVILVGRPDRLPPSVEAVRARPVEARSTGAWCLLDGVLEVTPPR